VSCVVLDAEALSALAGRNSKRQREVRAALAVALRLGREVVIPAVVLAELYRGRGRSALLDSCLSRETGLHVRDTDRALARLVGDVLTTANAGSEMMVDAHVVAAAVEEAGGLLLTGDARDLERLAGPYRNVVVVSIA
jgi:predicted nucleic acid-binding protein